ncbi:MAG: MBOAT family O-acyltransferase, partial [Cyclobacteriaceae bacterium]
RLLPQIENKRIFTFEKGRDGLKQILWGLFLKVVVADSCGEFVDQIFGRADGMNAPMLLLGAVLFSFQIYGDFAGYSEIAIGSAKLLGIDLMKNFRTPYFSRDIAEFWRRWHISLSTWFRDYLYIPLGGSRVSKFLNIRNVFLVFVISGFWHGANWTFIIWGFLHALFYLPLLIGGSNRNSLDNFAQGRLFPRFTDSVRVLGTFLLVSLAWIFFRAENLTMAFDYISGLSNWSSVKLQWIDYRALVLTAIYILLMVVIEWINRNEEFTLQRLPKNMFLRYPIYLFLSLLVVQYFSRGGEFIYFQF